MSESHEDFAKRMRRKRTPAERCIRCARKTHEVDGLHDCDGLLAQRFGSHGVFDARECSARPLCRLCTHCPECAGSKADRARARLSYQAEMQEAEERRRDTLRAKEQKQDLARAMIEQSLASRAASLDSMLAALRECSPELIGRLVKSLILEDRKRMSAVNFTTTRDPFTTQTQFTLEVTGWIEDVLLAANSEALAELRPSKELLFNLDADGWPPYRGSGPPKAIETQTVNVTGKRGDEEANDQSSEGARQRHGR